jgi:hypothetical protein
MAAAPVIRNVRLSMWASQSIDQLLGNQRAISGQSAGNLAGN